jgi:hypothetical protein
MDDTRLEGYPGASRAAGTPGTNERLRMDKRGIDLISKNLSDF